METLLDQILEKIERVTELYQRLIITVAPLGGGKTSTLQELGRHFGVPVLNVNLELSRKMLDLTERQRILQLPKLLNELVNGIKGGLAILDNIEILFDVSLKQDPLRLLQGISRNKTIVVAWNGSIDENNLIYAKPDHPEYQRYSAKDLLIVTPEKME
jgi:hypothetical protein